MRGRCLSSSGTEIAQQHYSSASKKLAQVSIGNHESESRFIAKNQFSLSGEFNDVENVESQNVRNRKDSSITVIIN